MSMKATLICDIVTLLFIGLLHASVHFQMGIVSWSLNSGATNCVKWMCTFQILTLVFSRWCSSIGRARALHARGTGIDARHLHRLSSATCFSGPMFLSKWHFIISSWWSILYWNFSTTAEYVIGHSVSSNEVYFSVTKCDQCALDANLLHRAKMWRVSFVLSLVVCLCAHGCFFLVSKHSSIKHRSTAVEFLSRRPICQNANAPEWLNYIHDFCACKTITYCMCKTARFIRFLHVLKSMPTFLPGVRIEIMTLRLWDSRAAYCAIEAQVKKSIHLLSNGHFDTFIVSSAVDKHLYLRLNDCFTTR